MRSSPTCSHVRLSSTGDFLDELRHAGFVALLHVAEAAVDESREALDGRRLAE